MLRKVLSLALAIIVCALCCLPIAAEADVLFVAVNDTIPLTLAALPYETSSGIYVPYTAFDASPGGVIPAYNAAAQTFVLFTRQRRLVFDLAEGTVTDQDGNTKTVSTTFRNGTLYVPLVYCASFFDLKVSMLKSQSGYPILRFTNGSEVYDDALFVEKAESLITYRIEQMNTENSAAASSGASVPSKDPAPEKEEPAPEQTPASVYLAFTGAQSMARNAELLKNASLRAAFFLTGAEITADPGLVRSLYAAGHVIGLTVPDDCEDVASSLLAANNALERALNRKTTLALLSSYQQSGIEDFKLITRPQEPLSAEYAAQQTAAPQLLIITGDAANPLAVLRAAGAELPLLRETAPLS